MGQVTAAVNAIRKQAIVIQTIVKPTAKDVVNFTRRMNVK